MNPYTCQSPLAAISDSEKNTHQRLLLFYTTDLDIMADEAEQVVAVVVPLDGMEFLLNRLASTLQCSISVSWRLDWPIMKTFAT